jgi:hypothetical protein
MTRLIGRFTLAAALAIAATVGLAAESWAVRELLPGGLYHFDFASHYPECFREVQRGGGITPGMDLGPARHTALNITGSAGSGGATWLTVTIRLIRAGAEASWRPPTHALLTAA